MIANLLFIFFSALLLGSALMVVISRQPVKSALFLVTCFFAATALWLLMNAEFLALVLILVYVGAVMTLFLFVIMTVNIDFAALKLPRLRYYLMLGLIAAACLVGILIYALDHTRSPFVIYAAAPTQITTPNTVQLGDVLYTQYVLAFEIAAVILLVAMIAAISLTLFQPIRRLQQNIDAQIKIKRDDRVRLVK